MTHLEKLTEIDDLRSVWPHEALDFTPWLAEESNISLLEDAVGLEIDVSETESSIGDFHVDIFATEKNSSRKIIIENQLEESNHDHLGKLITYASGKSANVVIWIVKRAREEHRAAIEWLNSHTDDDIGFFLCEVKLYKIGNSAPAVKFVVVEKPNDWTKTIRRIDANSPTRQFRLEYWTAFNQYAFTDAQTDTAKKYASEFNIRKPSTDHWMDLSIGSSAYHLAITQIIKHQEIGLELYINEDKNIYRQLENHRQEIEEQTGLTFEWQELPEKKASRIIIRTKVNQDDQSDWANQFEWIMKTALTMKRVFKAYL